MKQCSPIRTGHPGRGPRTDVRCHPVAYHIHQVKLPAADGVASRVAGRDKRAQRIGRELGSGPRVTHDRVARKLAGRHVLVVQHEGLELPRAIVQKVKEEANLAICPMPKTIQPRLTISNRYRLTRR